MTSDASDQLDTSRGKGDRPPSSEVTLTRAPGRVIRSGAAARAGCCWLLALSASLAQSGPTIVDFEPRPNRGVAPGDIVTLRVVGLKTVIPLLPDHSARAVKASGFPLPTELAGISVMFRRQGINLPGPPEPVPLFSIEQTPLCTDELITLPPPPDCMQTLITIQVPFFGAIPIGDKGGSFSILENGVAGKLSGAGGNQVNIHVLTTCSRPHVGLCVDEKPAVTHADGTLVTAASPARPGEVIIIYATGLGETVPPVPAGQATPTPAPRAGALLLFDFSPNAGPRRPYGDPAALPFSVRQEFSGLTPGQVGLYQINVMIPDTIPPVPPCGPGPPPYGWPVLSNLTITVSGDIFSNSLDSVAICVAPQQ